jgi:hypothetical protein
MCECAMSRHTLGASSHELNSVLDELGGNLEDLLNLVGHIVCVCGKERGVIKIRCRERRDVASLSRRKGRVVELSRSREGLKKGELKFKGDFFLVVILANLMDSTALLSGLSSHASTC